MTDTTKQSSDEIQAVLNEAFDLGILEERARAADYENARIEERDGEKVLVTDVAPSDKPADVAEAIVEDEIERQATNRGIAGSFVATLVFHKPSRLDDPDVPTGVALKAALAEFLDQKFGFEMGVTLTRTDR